MMSAQIDRLATEIGIRRLHALCADAVWRKDRQAFVDCFSCDGEWKVAGLHMRGHQAIGDGFESLLSLNERVLMSFASPILAFAPTAVCGRTYAVEHVKGLDGNGMVSIGIYHERFVELGGEWRFQWRHFDFCYFGPPDLSVPLLAFPERGPPPAMPAPNEPTPEM